MNGFERHSIDHSSVSAINAWEETPDQWVARYVLKMKTAGSAAMWRGICSEDIVVDVLAKDIRFDVALTSALAKFDKMNGGIGLGLDEKITKERGIIEPIATLAIEELQQYGKPEFADGGGQHKVSLTAKGEGWEIPVIGFLDLAYPQHGLVVDLKTTTKMPSSLSASHRRQRCFYQRCSGNSKVRFLYVTPKKIGWLDDGDVDAELASMKQQLARQEAFLSLGDADTLRRAVPVNPSHYFWRGSEDVLQNAYGF